MVRRQTSKPTPGTPLHPQPTLKNPPALSWVPWVSRLVGSHLSDHRTRGHAEGQLAPVDRRQGLTYPPLKCPGFIKHHVHRGLSRTFRLPTERINPSPSCILKPPTCSVTQAGGGEPRHPVWPLQLSTGLVLLGTSAPNA